MVLKIAKSRVEDKRKKPLIPQIEVFNKYKTNQFVNGIELTLDSYFSVKGIVEIYVGDETILDENDTQDFEQYRVYRVPINSKVLKPEQSIKIFVWNKSDDDTVTLSAHIIMYDEPKPSASLGTPVDIDQLNRHLSGGTGGELDSHILFPSQLYALGTYEKTVNTKGRKNMFLMMAASTVNPPTILPDTFAVDNPPTSLEIQMQRISYTPTSSANSWGYQEYAIRCDNVPVNHTPYISQFLLIDYLNTNRKNITFTLMSLTPTLIEYSYYFWYKYWTTGRKSTFYYKTIRIQILNSIKHIVEVSDDVTFQSGVTELEQYDFTGVQQTKKYPDIYKRYLRIKEVITIQVVGMNDQTAPQITPNITLNYTPSSKSFTSTNYYDELVHGGTAYLRFELKGLDGEWFTLISSNELGALTQGQKKLIEFNSSTSNHILPPTQDSFRAVLEVKNGLIHTGVSIYLVE